MMYPKTDKSTDPGKARRLLGGLLLWTGIVAIALASSGRTAPAKDKIMAVKAGKIQTAATGEIDKGVILIKNGLIIEVGAQVTIPADAEVLDFRDNFVMSGIVSPDSNLGVFKRSTSREEFFFGMPEPPGRNLAYYPVLYSIFPEHSDYLLALKNGFTTLAISPPPAGISGLGAVIRPDGESLKDMAVKEGAFLKLSIYVNTPFWNMLKGSLEEAQRLLDGKKKKAEEKKVELKEEKKKEKDKKALEAPPDEPTISPSAKVFMDVVQGTIPVVAECEGPDAVAHLLELLSAYPKVRLIVRGGPEVYRAGPLLKEKNVPLILEPVLDVRKGFYQPITEKINYVLKCQAQELRLAFQAPGNIEEQIHLLDALGQLYRLGIKKDVLLKGVTIVPSQILGIDSLVGSLEKGKKADLIVLKDDPFENVPRIEKVMLGGKIVQ